MNRPLTIRPMDAESLPAAALATAESLGIDISEPELAALWEGRLGHPFDTDPAGAFVAEADGEVIGAAQAIRRERLWCLSLLGVRPGTQSRGAGRALMEAALSYAPDAEAGLIMASNDPRALALYARAGFRLLPCLEATGPVDRHALPGTGGAVREDDGADLDALAAIAREIRGAPYTSELPYALARGARLLRHGDRGFAIAQEGRGVWLVAARDEDAGRRLLWAALEIGGDARRAVVRWLTAEQQWAIDVCLRAGLSLRAYGAVCVRGRPGTMRPFVPTAPFA